jgi:hypothetical protein
MQMFQEEDFTTSGTRKTNPLHFESHCPSYNRRMPYSKYSHLGIQEGSLEREGYDEGWLAGTGKRGKVSKNIPTLEINHS